MRQPLVDLQAADNARLRQGGILVIHGQHFLENVFLSLTSCRSFASKQRYCILPSLSIDLSVHGGI